MERYVAMTYRLFHAGAWFAILGRLETQTGLLKDGAALGVELLELLDLLKFDGSNTIIPFPGR